MLKPKVNSQLSSQTGMGRQGGASSKASTSTGKTKGSTFAAMENMLLRGNAPNPKSLSGNPQPSRQFMTQAAGGDLSGLTKVPGGSILSKPNKTGGM